MSSLVVFHTHKELLRHRAFCRTRPALQERGAGERGWAQAGLQAFKDRQRLGGTAEPRENGQGGEWVNQCRKLVVLEKVVCGMQCGRVRDVSQVSENPCVTTWARRDRVGCLTLQDARRLRPCMEEMSNITESPL